MMRGEQQQQHRGLQNQRQGIIVEYTQTVEYYTIDASMFTPELIAIAPFKTNDQRTAYVALLGTSSNQILAEVTGVSEFQLPPQSIATVAPSSVPPEKKDSFWTKTAIIGIACGGAGLLILVILFCIYCRSGGSDEGGDDAKSGGEPPMHVSVRDDEISTLAGPNGPPTYGDQRYVWIVSGWSPTSMLLVCTAVAFVWIVCLFSCWFSITYVC